MSEDTKSPGEIIGSPRTLSVLLVDDQPIIAEGIRRMVADEGDIELHYCQDPADALRMARDTQPMVILQDLVMPEMDGMTLVRFFRANAATAKIPVIVLSSKEDPLTKSEAFGNGASDYLVKLPDKIELIARIRAHATSYLAQRERDSAFEALREMQKKVEQSNRELQRLSSLDGLTGIANRRQFDEVSAAEWRRAFRAGSPLAIILVDIDFFKRYNDNYGHQGGDECLKRVADALDRTLSRAGDLIARYGGEEFVAILPNNALDGALHVAERMRAAVAELRIAHQQSDAGACVSISVGVASAVPTTEEGMEELIAIADKALYQAKERGRDCIVGLPLQSDSKAQSG